MTRALPALVALAITTPFVACNIANAGDDADAVVIAASAVGAEGDALKKRVAEFERAHRGVHVEIREAPAGGDERHQLYVQWLAAGAHTPDVLQIDLVTTAELAAAGFLAPIDERVVDGFFPSALDAVRVTTPGVDGSSQRHVYAAPWFVDVGVLYWRTDVYARAPATLNDLARVHGYAWQGARYEGLVCNYLEVLAAMGGSILDDNGNVVVDSEAGVRALAFLTDLVGTASPKQVTSFQEEEARFAFQNGEATLMRNWPYAAPLLEDTKDSKVAHAFAVAPVPGDGVHPGRGALGGQALAINARALQPELARELIRFLVDDDAQIERARSVGEAPPKRALYDGDALRGLLPFAKSPADARALFENAVARPASPAWSELSGILAAHLHAALTHQATPSDAIHVAANEMRAALARNDLNHSSNAPPSHALLIAIVLACVVIVFGLVLALAPRRTREGRDARFGWRLAVPCVLLVVVTAGVPLVMTLIDSTLDIDLRAPWRGAPFVGLALYVDALASSRFIAAFAHTLFFASVTVALEVLLGVATALVLANALRARGPLRSVVLLPWAVPTVVSALVWRLFFAWALPQISFFTDAKLAWIPIIVADVWKSTPFVTLIVLAGLMQIDPALDEAARVDGASTWQRFARITLPLLRPSLAVAVVFRLLDALRVFDIVFVLTGGGPGTATEPLSLLAYDAFMRDLRFGAGSAVSMLLFGAALALALVYVRIADVKESA